MLLFRQRVAKGLLSRTIGLGHTAVIVTQKPTCTGPERLMRLSRNIANWLNNKDNKSVLIWAWQRFLWPAHHLGFDLTRYAHFYPQDLWKTRGDHEDPL